MKHLLATLLLAPLAVLPAADLPTSAPASWSEDFSDAKTLTQNWRPYGFLASGIDAKHPLGKTVSGKDARPEWWQIVDGALRGQCFPEEKHPPGMRRSVSGTDLRVSCRFKLAPDGQIGISFVLITSYAQLIDTNRPLPPYTIEDALQASKLYDSTFALLVYDPEDDMFIGLYSENHRWRPPCQKLTNSFRDLAYMLREIFPERFQGAGSDEIGKFFVDNL